MDGRQAANESFRNFRLVRALPQRFQVADRDSGLLTGASETLNLR